MKNEELLKLIDRFHRAFPEDPPGALRDFVRVEERLAGDGDAAAARSLSDALWVLAPEIPFRSDGERAEFFLSFGKFLGNPGPAFDPDRAEDALEVPLMVWREETGPERRREALQALEVVRRFRLGEEAR